MLLVEAAAASRAAGICLSIGDVHTSAPPALIEACRIAGVPLLLMPHGVAFSSINDYLVDLLSRQQSESVGKSAGNGQERFFTAQVLQAAAESLSGRLSKELGNGSAL